MELYFKRKRVADGLLFFSIFLLVGCLLIGAFYQKQLSMEWQRVLLQMMTFIAEAALVASVADYIAVTALTKQILWFKSTGLISRKREEIIKSIVKAIEVKLFTRDLLVAELENRKFDETIIRYLKTEGLKKDGAELLKKAIDGLEKDRARIGEYLEKPVKELLKKVD